MILKLQKLLNLREFRKKKGEEKEKKVPPSRYLRHIAQKGVLLYSYPDTVSQSTIAQV